jgi:hypothetical protein
MNFVGFPPQHDLFIGAMNLRKGDVLPGNVLPTSRPPLRSSSATETGRQNKFFAGKMPAER